MKKTDHSIEQTNIDSFFTSGSHNFQTPSRDPSFIPNLNFSESHPQNLSVDNYDSFKESWMRYTEGSLNFLTKKRRKTIIKSRPA